MPLRDYQTRAVEDTLHALAEVRSVVTSLPTGAGKTEIAAEIVRRHPGPVVFAAHRRSLITQAAERFRRLGIPCGVVMAGVAPTTERVQVGSIQSLSRRDLPPCSLLVIDEAHRSRSEQYAHVLNAYRASKVLGLTATPFRLDGKGLADVFERLVVGPTSAQLVRDGWLVPARVLVPPGISTDGLKVRAGEFEQEKLSERSGGPTLTGDVATHFVRHGSAPAILFAVGVANSKAFAAALTAAGASAEHLDGQTPHDEREAVLSRLAAGTTQVVCNADLMGEGVDLPALRTVIMARPTASLGLFLQQLGRGTRRAEGKDSFLVLDHAGNFERFADRLDFVQHPHGVTVDAHAVTLAGAAKKSEPAVGAVRRCPSCFALCVAGTETCWQCGAVLPARPAPEVVVLPEDLVPLTFIERAATTWDDKREWWTKHGGAKESSRMFRHRFGHLPPLYRGRFLSPHDDRDAAARLALLQATKWAMGPKGAFLVRSKFGGAWPTDV